MLRVFGRSQIFQVGKIQNVGFQGKETSCFQLQIVFQLPPSRSSYKGL